MITREYLIECFSYNDQSGDLFWKSRPLSHFNSEMAMRVSNSRTSGKVVKSLQKNKNGKSYIKAGISTKLGKKQLLAHRVIWMMTHGSWPELIDHVNGDGTDNRMCNIREVSVEQNNRNMKLMRHNSSGFTGVHSNRYGTWTSYIWNKGKQINIGTYITKKEAIAARAGAERALGYSHNHGEVRDI